MLDVATADREQMSFLLEGFQVVLEMANGLKIYWEFFAALPTNTATEKFGVALPQFYILTLEFFADTIACYGKSTSYKAHSVQYMPPLTLVSLRSLEGL